VQNRLGLVGNGGLEAPENVSRHLALRAILKVDVLRTFTGIPPWMGTSLTCSRRSRIQSPQNSTAQNSQAQISHVPKFQIPQTSDPQNSNSQTTHSQNSPEPEVEPASTSSAIIGHISTPFGDVPTIDDSFDSQEDFDLVVELTLARQSEIIRQAQQYSIAQGHLGSSSSRNS